MVLVNAMQVLKEVVVVVFKIAMEMDFVIQTNVLVSKDMMVLIVLN